MTARIGQRLAGALVLLGLIFAATTGCGGSASGEKVSDVLSSSEAREVLKGLSYDFSWRRVDPPKGATGAVAGRAVGPKHAVINFGVSLGRHPSPVAVPGAGTGEAYGYLRAGYIYTDDLQVPGPGRGWIKNPRFRTFAQWYEAGHMEVAMEEKLCEAATGEPCREG